MNKVTYVKRDAGVLIGADQYFDAEKVYDEEIKPLMDQIKAIAAAHGIPFVMAFNYAKHPDLGFMTGAITCNAGPRTSPPLNAAALMLRDPEFGNFVVGLLDAVSEAADDAVRQSPAGPVM